jgi:transposase InsO family protein
MGVKRLLRRPLESAQYACGPYRRILDRYGIQASMSRKGNCYDCETIEAVWMV